MNRYIKWELICKHPQIFLIDSFQIFSNDELFDPFVEKNLSQLLANSVPDLRKDQLFESLLDYLKTIAQHHCKDDYSDLIRIIHSNIKIFSITNLGIRAGVKQFKPDFVLETICPLFEDYFEKPLGTKDNWCKYENNEFNFHSLIYYCLILANKYGNLLSEIAQLITIFSNYLDFNNLFIIYKMAQRLPNISKIMKSENLNGCELKIKYLLSCIAYFDVTDNKSCEFVEKYLKSPLMMSTDIGEYGIFYDVINLTCLIDSCLMDESKYFYVNGMYINKIIDESSFMDYSIISMQFYKAIEVELKRRFIHPALIGINFDSLKRCISLNVKNVENITLGNINYMFKWLFTNWDNNITTNVDEINFKNKLKKMFNFDKRYVNELKTIIDSKNLDKYRNPPAHTRTMEYSYAEESHKTFIFFVYLINMISAKIDYYSLINNENTPFLM